jgi:septum site-determining protein MinC
MTVALAGPQATLFPPSPALSSDSPASSAAAAAFELKSAQLPLLALQLKTADLAQLNGALAARYGADGDSPNFFEHDGLVLDCTALADGAALDLPALLALLRPYSLVPVALRGGNAGLVQAALAAGLVLAPPETRLPQRAAQPPAEPDPAAPAVPQPAAPAPTASPTLVVDKPLRSGQKVYARGGDLVVLAMVNPGAEVVADGNIHVYAPLRGKAIAGARGHTAARIFALSLEPELIAIAGTYRTSENPLPAAIQGKPAQVRLAGDGDDARLMFEPLKA